MQASKPYNRLHLKRTSFLSLRHTLTCPSCRSLRYLRSSPVSDSVSCRCLRWPPGWRTLWITKVNVNSKHGMFVFPQETCHVQSCCTYARTHSAPIPTSITHHNITQQIRTSEGFQACLDLATIAWNLPKKSSPSCLRRFSLCFWGKREHELRLGFVSSIKTSVENGRQTMNETQTINCARSPLIVVCELRKERVVEERLLLLLLLLAGCRLIPEKRMREKKGGGC